MSQITLQLEKLTCPSCMQTIIQTTNKLNGVEKTKILFDSSKARVTFSEEIITETEIMDKINDMGYQSRKI
ncbi:Copper chaperone CopZ [Atopostipes suicloacalis DSM 15692]|uniref:Copper chaperone CopZ n=1 Tax=Atopostipes suicloacalis DSM 15692 TaxID=1121025 RepID=A0A1M4UEG6_9LACT|nr:heavy-metal-associated domain-containing protein [Atopostipes suicloacalis]SHE54973.1 Copper chaperone CopZ [Atopostipes suicloacalis DSM 15692]